MSNDCKVHQTKKMAEEVLKKLDVPGSGVVRIPLPARDAAFTYCPACLGQLLFLRDRCNGKTQFAIANWEDVVDG